MLHGTGVGAHVPGRADAGKTGTTDDYADAWFCGYTPSLEATVWMGYPTRRDPDARRARRRRLGPDAAGDGLAAVHGAGGRAARRTPRSRRRCHPRSSCPGPGTTPTRHGAAGAVVVVPDPPVVVGDVVGTVVVVVVVVPSVVGAVVGIVGVGSGRGRRGRRMAGRGGRRTPCRGLTGGARSFGRRLRRVAMGVLGDRRAGRAARRRAAGPRHGPGEHSARCREKDDRGGDQRGSPSPIAAW